MQQQTLILTHNKEEEGADPLEQDETLLEAGLPLFGGQCQLLFDLNLGEHDGVIVGGGEVWIEQKVVERNRC